MEDFWALMDEYKDTFNEPLPLMALLGVSEQEIMAIARRCIQTGKKYEPKSEVVY